MMPYRANCCPNCGVHDGYGTNYCRACGQPAEVSAAFCPNCGAALRGPNQMAESRKSRLAAGLLGIFLGGLGIHNFYLGYKGRGILQLALTVMSFGIASVWGMIEGILILCGVYRQTDANGYYLDR